LEYFEGNEKIWFQFHDLRHTFGSRLGMSGQDMKTIMEIMEHITHKMAMRYQHPVPAHKLDAVKKLDSISRRKKEVIKLENRNTSRQYPAKSLNIHNILQPRLIL